MVYQKLCKACDKLFEGHKNAQFCEINCGRRYRTKLKKPLYNKTCLFCSISFIAKRKDKEFCTKKCNLAHWQSLNKDKEKQYRKLHSDKRIKLKAEWYINNKARSFANAARYRAQKLSATLLGYDKEILKIYEVCPPGSHVHHIIPLQEFNHLGIYGLHVPWNLEILIKEEHYKVHEELRKTYK